MQRRASSSSPSLSWRRIHIYVFKLFSFVSIFMTNIWSSFCALRLQFSGEFISNPSVLTTTKCSVAFQIDQRYANDVSEAQKSRRIFRAIFTRQTENEHWSIWCWLLTHRDSVAVDLTSWQNVIRRIYADAAKTGKRKNPLERIKYMYSPFRGRLNKVDSTRVIVCGTRSRIVSKYVFRRKKRFIIRKKFVLPMLLACSSASNAYRNGGSAIITVEWSVGNISRFPCNALLS